MKKNILGITILCCVATLFYGGIHLFGKFIYNTQSCERFNIDNIELRTGINIPEVTSTDCECNGNKKISKFVIDTDKVDLEDYVSRNDFTPINELYIKENDNKNSNYKVVFDKNTAELTVNLIYKDN